MAIAGRKPDPIPLRLLKGNTSNRRIPKTAEAETRLPKCPEWLNPVAKTEWKRAGAILEELRLISELDSMAFAVYCENCAVIIQCSNYIKAQGGYAKYLSGKNSQTAPHLAAMNKAYNNIKSFCAEFGMTPSSRGRIEIPDAPLDDCDYLD